jgi:BMFP domain-containing protein YqiC
VKTPSETLSERGHELVHTQEQHRPILSTTGTRAAIESLTARVESLEAALSEVASVVQELAQSQRSTVR